MITVSWGDALRAEYKTLFDTCVVHQERMGLADAVGQNIVKGKARYETIATLIGCPWWFVGVLHLMECGLSFSKHLHNGDPLSARTKRVPAGRPLVGNPPFTFEASALDALRLKGIDKIKDWSIEHVLYLIEGFNGYGYRQYHPTVKTPYLWSMTNHYTRGKYVADGKYDPNCVSGQLGVAAVLKRLVEKGAIKVCLGILHAHNEAPPS